jgi:serine/threonine protein kinase
MQADWVVFIFMRYAENGDLLDYVKTHKIEESRANLWFYQLVSNR